MRKPLFISSVLGANILEVAACGRENADESGIRGGGEESNDCTALAGLRIDVGVCAEDTADGAGANNLLVTVWGLVFEENNGNSGAGEELAEMEAGAGVGEEEVGEGVGAGTRTGAGGAGTKILVVTTCGRDTTVGRTTGFTSGSTSFSPAVS
jgi:hypothetical protein